ncbi:HAD-IA family hydrolase [Saccharopolyspora gloriosae]|uniref:Phosphoglycolate phosphatase-like HAD superfamily hydrolase n=1 Tax=Saccharopolyspora gloriosae TaxID=455344 RepID=A0A840NCF0_9PSEU|nr:HAD family hydrolase [Saccharopolyspora gloriosae]MBB5068601.1 phosphoglycolate phosphatase-like HAD superfamily hydrolase [Saccharopolyspora gloriosae]
MAEFSGHIVWDWNGTLLDDGQVVIDSVAAAFADAGHRVTREDHQRHFTRPISAFCDRLAGRALSPDELAAVLRKFDECYDLALPHVPLAEDARFTLAAWTGAGGTQSLLSMCPHDVLLPAVRRAGIESSFRHVQGRTGAAPDTKAAHIERHLAALGSPDPREVVLIGDTVDDTETAAAVGAHCVIYHSGPTALHALDHFTGRDVPITTTLSAAVERANALLSG